MRFSERSALGVWADRQVQNGFALLTVLLIVALVSIISANLFSSQQGQIQRSGFMLHQAQALSVQWGLEDWVKQGLKLDGENNKTDHLQELWAQPFPPVPFADGEVGGFLQDAQGRLNLNNVLANDESERKLWQNILNRYVSLVLAESGESVQLNGFSDLLTDWVDSDNEPLEQGAESDRYQLLTPSYSAANQPMVTIEALNNFPEIQTLSWTSKQRLKANLIALPKVVKVNINTVQEAVLLSFAQWMTPQIAQTWLLQRQQQPAETVDEFTRFLSTQTGLSAEEIAQDLPASFLTVSSEFFLLTGQLSYGLVERSSIYSLFYRDAQHQVQLVQRWLGFAE